MKNINVGVERYTLKTNDFDKIKIQKRISDEYFEVNGFLKSLGIPKIKRYEKWLSFIESDELVDYLVFAVRRYEPELPYMLQLVERSWIKDQLWVHPIMFLKFLNWVDTKITDEVIKEVKVNWFDIKTANISPEPPENLWGKLKKALNKLKVKFHGNE